MDDNPQNIDPTAYLSALSQGLVQMHEIYSAAVDAGFTESQAMQIVLTALATFLGR